jgi:hypothetical protein
MEIISYVLQGELAHKDSMGNVKGIPPGDVQRMSAGSGVMHSEFNHAPNATTHFLQIWIEPNVRGIAPSYEQKTFSTAEKTGRLRLVASPSGAEGSVTLPADAALYAGLLDAEHRAEVDGQVRSSLKSDFLLDAIVQAEDVQVTEIELTEYLVRTSQRYGMAPQQFAEELQKAGQIQQLVAEVTRAKALASVLGRITVKDASGNVVDLEALAPKADPADLVEEA